MEELTAVCQAQTKELAAKEAIITYLKQKVKSLEHALSERSPCSYGLDQENTGAGPLQTSTKKRKAHDEELQTPQHKVAKATMQAFLKAASDEMKSCIKWGGLLLVEFSTNVEPEVFAKVFDGCKRGWPCKPIQEPGELPQKCVTETIDLDREDMLRIFGKSRAGRKFRYSGQGTVESLTITYNKLSKVAQGKGSWAFSQNAD